MKNNLRFGSLVWLLSLIVLLPFFLQSEKWVYLLILFAPLVLMPMLFSIAFAELIISPLYYGIAVFLFATAFILPQGIFTAVLVLPYWAYVGLLAFRQIRLFLKKSKIGLKDMLISGAWIFLVVGITWAFADRLGYRPFDFSAIIVLLTAAHFHYAGFFIPVLASLIVDQLNSTFGWSLTTCILFGFILTAIGITVSHFGGPIIIEKLAALMMVLGGILLAFGQLAYIRKEKASSRFQILMILSSVSLLFTMLLAMGYAMRLQHIFPILSIPWMYAVHGSLNVFAVCGLATLAWYFEKDLFLIAPKAS